MFREDGFADNGIAASVTDCCVAGDDGSELFLIRDRGLFAALCTPDLFDETGDHAY